MQALKLPTVITGFFGVMNIVGNIRNFQLNQSHKDPIDGWADGTNKVNNLLISQLRFEIIEVVGQLLVFWILMPKKLKTSLL